MDYKAVWDLCRYTVLTAEIINSSFLLTCALKSVWKQFLLFYLRNRRWKTLLARKILSRSSLAQWFVSKFWLTKLMLILPWQYLSVSPQGAVADWWVCAHESEPTCLWWTDKSRMTLQTKQTMRDRHISAYSTILSPVVEEESGKGR